jgi:hypothetical protein
MKILGLCVLMVLCLASVCRAQEPAKSTNDDLAAAQNLFPEVKARESLRIRKYPDSLADGEPYCAFMRVYRVKRERGSDVVWPAGYTTCVASWRFELKSALEVVQEPSEQ